MTMRPGKLARHFGVVPKTVVSWIDKELLRAFRLPGSGHRRIALEDANEFAARHGYPKIEPDAPTKDEP